MEEELDPSSMGQSFEKVGESISEAQMRELQTLGPLDQNGDLTPEKWLQNTKSTTSAGTKANKWEDSHVLPSIFEASKCSGFFFYF